MNRSAPGSDCDILIVGAGLVGSCCALALAREGLKIIMLDKQAGASSVEEEPLRVSALNLASQNILSRLGVWQTIAAGPVTPFEQIAVWDASSRGEISFDAASIGAPALGHIVVDSEARAALHHALTLEPMVSIIAGESILSLETSEDKAVITTSEGNDFTAQLVVGADGAESQVRELIGIDSHQAAYDQVAIVATVTPQKPHERCARQRFLSTGPLAFLPFTDSRCSIVWSVATEKAKELLSLDDRHFAQALADAFDQRLGAMQSVSPRKSFPLIRRHVETYIDQRLALIGDAAHTVHPLAGLGANQGLADAAALAQIIGDARAHNRDFGNRSVLRRYERWRRGENSLVLEIIGGFHSLFSTESGTRAKVRGIGLDLADRSGVLKTTLIEYAVGLSGDLPELARP